MLKTESVTLLLLIYGNKKIRKLYELNGELNY